MVVLLLLIFSEMLQIRCLAANIKSSLEAIQYIIWVNKRITGCSFIRSEFILGWASEENRFEFRANCLVK